jgi:hypothetical protein
MGKEQMKRFQKLKRGANTVYMDSDTTLGSHDYGFHSQQRTPSEPILVKQRSGQTSHNQQASDFIDTPSEPILVKQRSGQSSHNQQASDFNDTFFNGQYGWAKSGYSEVSPNKYGETHGTAVSLLFSCCMCYSCSM